jgi:thymidylate kinase
MEATPEQFQWAVHDAFRRIADAEPSRVRTVDASRSAVAVSEDVVSLVVTRLNDHRAASTASPAVAGRS